MNENETEDRFAQRVAGMLRADAADVPAGTAAQLARSRRLALEAAGAARHAPLRWLAPVGTVAAAVLIGLLLTGRDSRQAGIEADGASLAMSDMELFIDADAWELAQEGDLEFIEWAAEIARQEGAGG